MEEATQPQPAPADYVEIPLEPTNIIDRALMKWNLKPRVARYPLRSILYGNRIRIAEKAITLPKDFFKDSEDLLTASFSNTALIKEDLLYIAAVALQNNRREPSKKLISRLKWLDDSTFYRVFDEAVSMLDIQSFLKCIALVQGTEILLRRKTTKDAN